MSRMNRPCSSCRDTGMRWYTLPMPAVQLVQTRLLNWLQQTRSAGTSCLVQWKRAAESLPILCCFKCAVQLTGLINLQVASTCKPRQKYDA